MIIDQSIPYRHIIMRLDPKDYIPREPRLPEGYSFHRFGEGDEREWAKIQHSVNEFPTAEEAYDYYRRDWCEFYGTEKLASAQYFVKSPSGELIADTMLRPKDIFDHLRVTRLDWVACMPEHQGQGIATALLRYILNEAVELRPSDPIYLPTQPGSYAAVRMYWNLGFRVCRTSAIDDEEKPEADALDIIESYYPDGFGAILRETSVE